MPPENSTNTSTTPENIEVLLRLAEARYDLKDYNGAIKFYNKILEINPEDPWAYWERGLARKAKNDYKGAFDDFNKTIELDPNNSFAYFQRAIIKEQNGDVNGAKSDFSKVNELRVKLSEENDKAAEEKKAIVDYSKEKDGRAGGG